MYANTVHTYTTTIRSSRRRRSQGTRPAPTVDYRQMLASVVNPRAQQSALTAASSVPAQPAPRVMSSFWYAAPAQPVQPVFVTDEPAPAPIAVAPEPITAPAPATPRGQGVRRKARRDHKRRNR